MPLEEDVRRLREQRVQYETDPVPMTLQGVGKERIRAILAKIDCATDDMVDAVCALLDNETGSWFSRAPDGTKFSDGATTAHIGCHIGVLQRGASKLDREGRDYWIKPLRDLGAIEAVYFHSKKGTFIPGHPVPKSSNSAYRLAEEFREILLAGESDWESMLEDWIKEENIRKRGELQARMAERSRRMVDTKHSDLIEHCRDDYAPNFLPGYEIIFVDEANGERMTSEEVASLSQAGLTIGLGDAMPDLLLWNPSTDHLWVVEAVTSDGEVDTHKFNQLTELASRSGKAGIGFTTAYITWKDAARRQSQYKNIAPNTYIWIVEDPSKHLHVLEMLALTEPGFGEFSEDDV